MSNQKKTLVVGGSRGTGLLVANLLLSRSCSVRVFARNPVSASARLGPSCEITSGDITVASTIPHSLEDVDQVVFTAGCRSGRPATSAKVELTEFHGVRHVLEAAQVINFPGRFVYMTSSGVTTESFSAVLLNLYKGNTLKWRRKAEEMIRSSGLDYTIVRAGVLLNRIGGQHSINVTQEALPLSLKYRISRADVAEAIVASLEDPRTVRTTFDIVWGQGTTREAWPDLFDGLKVDEDVA